MIHFRKIIFDLIDRGMNDAEIVKHLWEQHNMNFTPPRVVNYRETYDKLNQAGRERFIQGELSLLGDPL